MLKLVVLVVLLAIAVSAVTPLDCDPIGEELQECTKPTVRCEQTCDTFRTAAKKQVCPCEEKCVCKQKFVRNAADGNCVYRFQCPNGWWPWGGWF